MGVHLYTNGAWTDSGRIYRNSANIININDHDTSNGFIENSYLKSDGSVVPFSEINNGFNISEYIPIEPNTTYSYGDKNSHSVPSVCEYNENKQFIIGHAFNRSNVVTFTTTNNSKYVRISIYFIIMPTSQSFESYPMFNVGSTLLNYEPYNVVDWYANTGRGYTSGAWD